MKTKFTTLEWEDRLAIGYALFEAGMWHVQQIKGE